MKNYQHRLLAILLAIFLFCGLTVSAFADDMWDQWERARLMDEDGRLSEGERQNLLTRLDTLSEQYQMDFVIVTAPTLGDYSPQEFSDRTFLHFAFGQGDEQDGILLMVCMESRDWYIATHGRAIYLFTDSVIQSLGDSISGYLANNSFAYAFDTYLNMCEYYIASDAEADSSYNDGAHTVYPPLIYLPVCLLIGFIIALIAVAVMKSKLKSVRYQAAADNYIRPGSMQLTESGDLFLYNTVSRVARPKDNDSSSGSSTHSTSGSSFGGGGGKF